MSRPGNDTGAGDRDLNSVAGPPRFDPLHRGGEGEPLLVLHGFTANWRTWELILPALEAHHDVLAQTLAGHAGGPPLSTDATTDAAIVDAVEAVMDEAGWHTAHLVGNSLGGYLAFLLAARGRARSVTALAPAGGWAQGDPAFAATLAYFRQTQTLVREAAPHADRILATTQGRQRATVDFAANNKHMSTDLIKNLMLGAAACDGAGDFIEFVQREGWHLDPRQVRCPIQLIWGTADRILPLPSFRFSSRASGSCERFGRLSYAPTRD